MFINMKAIKFLGGRLFLKAKAASPEIMLGAGLVCGAAAIVTACIASRKVDQIVKETNDDLDIMEDGIAHARTKEEVSEFKKETARIWVGTAWKFVKLYGPTALLAMASGAFILTSHGILKNRYLSTAAAYKALDEAYKAYRKNVAETLGYGDGEKVLAAGGKDIGPANVLQDDGTVKKEDGSHLLLDCKKSPYEFDFNIYTSPQVWSPNPEINKITLNHTQNYFNDLLQHRGHVFLNEVLDELGLERTTAGQVVGWFKGCGDNQIDFGFLDGYIRDWNTDTDLCKKNIRLNFNCDGVIYDMLPKET